MCINNINRSSFNVHQKERFFKAPEIKSSIKDMTILDSKQFNAIADRTKGGKNALLEKISKINPEKDFSDLLKDNGTVVFSKKEARGLKHVLKDSPLTEKYFTSSAPGLEFSVFEKKFRVNQKTTHDEGNLADGEGFGLRQLFANSGPEEIEANVDIESELKDLSKIHSFGLPMQKTSDRKIEEKNAIEDSGVVPEHAEAISAVAKEKNEFIMVRPVNQQCTPLIENSNSMATKHLHIKSKSSDWGPQAGLIPVDGSYCKLGNPQITSDKKDINGMSKSTDAAKHSIEEGWAIAKPLETKGTDQNNNKRFYVVPKDGVTDKPLEMSLAELKDYNDKNNDKQLKTLDVLCDPSTQKPIAADYDIFAIGPKVSEDKDGLEEIKDNHMGVLNDKQKGTIIDLNVAVMTTGYEGGRVVHHGTETRNPVTELDFPLTSFNPDGSVTSVKNQEQLVDFFNSKIKDGYNLSPNPLWLQPPNDKEPKWNQWKQISNDPPQYSLTAKHDEENFIKVKNEKY